MADLSDYDFSHLDTENSILRVEVAHQRTQKGDIPPDWRSWKMTSWGAGSQSPLWVELNLRKNYDPEEVKTLCELYGKRVLANSLDLSLAAVQIYIEFKRITVSGYVKGASVNA